MNGANLNTFTYGTPIVTDTAFTITAQLFNVLQINLGSGTPPTPTITFVRIPPMTFSYYRATPNNLIAITGGIGGTVNGTGHITYTMKFQKGMIGQYYISIDYGTTFSTPIEIKTDFPPTTITISSTGGYNGNPPWKLGVYTPASHWEV